MTRVRRGFTLLEVMVAVAILGLGFTMLLEAHGRAALATIDTRHVTIGTILARGKMLDIEAELKRDGFGDFDKVIDGDFSEEGWPDYKWTAVLRKIEIPAGKIGDLANASQDLGSMMGAPGGGAGSAAAAAGAPGGGAGGGANLGMLTPVLQTVSDVVGQSAREVTLEVRFPEGGRLTTMNVTTHMVDDVKLGAELAKVAAMTAGLQQLGNMANQLGGGPPGTPPPGTPPPGTPPPGTPPPGKQGGIK